MLIPQALLEADTLTRLIEDFVTREGTEIGRASCRERVSSPV